MKRANCTDPAKSTTYGMTVSKDAGYVFLILYGQLVSLKNSRRIVRNRRTGQIQSIKSANAEAWRASAHAQIPKAARLSLGSLTAPLKATCTVFYPSYRQDLDTALLWDVLQEAGVIANDRFLREKHEYAEIDKRNPRVEVVIELM